MQLKNQVETYQNTENTKNNEQSENVEIKIIEN